MKIFRWFDKLEDSARHRLSHHPIIYAFLGGVGVVLFWRGVWHFADQYAFMTPIVSIVLSTLLMLITGTFVSIFIGSRLLLSGLMKEKRIDEKTAEEVADEEVEIKKMRKAIYEIKSDLEEIKQRIK